MDDFALVRELSRRVLYNVGGTQSLVGKVSLTNNYFLQEKKIEVDIGAQDLLACSVWSAQSGDTTSAICIIDTDVISVFGISNIYFGFQFDSSDESDSGSYLIKSDDKADKIDSKWVKMDMVQKLNFVSILEFMNKEGLVWDKTKIQDKMYNSLCEIIETGV